MNENKYLVICIGYECNNDCIICMIGNVKQNLKPTSFEEFKKIVKSESKKHESLIISGAEVTLVKKLPDFIKHARKVGNFKHIQIQTNGRRLSDSNYCKSLVESGADEFFISIYGPNQDIHELHTKTKNSFNETMKGMKNLNKLNVSAITNTVITSLNYKHLPEISDILSQISSVKEIQFWNYNTMSKIDDKNLLESNINIKPYLLRSIEIGKNMNVPVIVKYFPECLLEQYRSSLDNSQPSLIIDERFWDEYKKNEFGQCVFMNKCNNRNCFGLTTAYIRKYGWDKELLKII